MKRALWPDDMDAAQKIAACLAPPPWNAIIPVAGRPGAGLAGFTGLGLRNHAEGCGPGPVADAEGRYVDADLRGPAIGQNLVRAGEDWARARGLSGIASDALVANEASIAAHRALGSRPQVAARDIHSGFPASRSGIALRPVSDR